MGAQTTPVGQCGSSGWDYGSGWPEVRVSRAKAGRAEPTICGHAFRTWHLAEYFLTNQPNWQLEPQLAAARRRGPKPAGGAGQDRVFAFQAGGVDQVVVEWMSALMPGTLGASSAS
jgi:hypothetical protein